MEPDISTDECLSTSIAELEISIDECHTASNIDLDISMDECQTASIIEQIKILPLNKHGRVRYSHR